MGESEEKRSRILGIFFRMVKGEKISIRKISEEYEISTKSVSRYVNEIKNFLADYRELVGNTSLEYFPKEKMYQLKVDGFLQSAELVGLAKILVGSRALEKVKVLEIIQKLKEFTTTEDQKTLDRILLKELYHYEGVGHDCPDVLERVWQLTNCIRERKKLTIGYYKMNREKVERKIHPIAIIFSEYYFYLIANKEGDLSQNPVYFRVDRIISVMEHRTKFDEEELRKFDEGELRKKIQFMFPGEHQKIRFEFTGPSVQAVLDRLPTAKILEKKKGGYVIEAEVYGDGIKMFLLSQGSWVKVQKPEKLAVEMEEEITRMKELYATAHVQK